MTYSREVTNKIVECWGLGFTAEETVRAVEEWKGITIALNTVYRHRHGITAQQIIDELIRKQLRDIAKDDNSDLRMKYRDKLLDKLIPHRIEAMSKHVEQVDVHVEHIDWALTEHAKVIGEAVKLNLRAHNTQKQMDTLEKPPRNRRTLQVTS